MAVSLSVLRRLGGQFAVTALCGLVGWVAVGAGAAGAWVFGGLTALINAALLAWRMSGDGQRQGADAHGHLRLFFRSSFERFAAVIVLLVIGLVGLKLSPLYVMAGFIVGQLIFVAASIGIRERE